MWESLGSPKLRRSKRMYYSPNLLIQSVEISQLWLVVSKKLRALYEVQLLEIYKIPQLNLI